MKAPIRRWLIVLGLFAAFAVAYHLHESPGRILLTTEQARRLPAIVPPQPTVDEDARRARQEFLARLAEIQDREIRERLANFKVRPGMPPLPEILPDGYVVGAPAEPVPPDPARPVVPLE